MRLHTAVPVLILLLFFLFHSTGVTMSRMAPAETGDVLVLQLAQDYVTITIDSRQISLVPEDTAPLLATHPDILADPDAAGVVQSDTTLFWEEIGPYGPDLSPNSSLASVVIVQIDSGNVSEFVVSLSTSDDSVLSTQQIESTSMGNLSAIIRSATDFFANDGLYWGLCEEMILLPGVFLDQSADLVWRLRFYLIAEGERWSLLLDTSGAILDQSATMVPCRSCSDLSAMTVVALSLSVITVLVLVLLRARYRHPDRPACASGDDQSQHQEPRT